MKRKLLSLLLALCSVFCLVSCKEKNDESIITIRNLYFNQWTGGDAYTDFLEKKFEISISPTAYSYNDWDQQVYGPVQANNLSDVFHFNLDSYNFSNSYVHWVKGKVIKALPDNFDKWPNIKATLNKVSNIDQFYIDGKLYCLPIIKDLKNIEAEYSPFTYVYRRDWAKELNVYKENDIYTWDEFIALLDAFNKAKNVPNGQYSHMEAALADVEWGYPSITNFYKSVPHCFAVDAAGNVVSNYTTPEYLEALELAKQWSQTGSKQYYGLPQYEYVGKQAGEVTKKYTGKRIGVLYENLSYDNYSKIRKTMQESLSTKDTPCTKAELDDATAIMKVLGPDGKYHLEGTENWYSATFFNEDISDAKMEKILDLLDYLLSEEGTMLALYGFEDYDYTVDSDGNVELTEAGWEKDMDGKYIDKLNGAKYLRYMITLGNDTLGKDPLTDKDSLNILNAWKAEMDQAIKDNKLVVLKERGDVKWLATPHKAEDSGALLEGANATVFLYCNPNPDKGITKEQYLARFNTKQWQDVLKEINDALKK